MSTWQMKETHFRFPFAAVPSSPLAKRAGQDPSRLLVRTEFLRRTGACAGLAGAVRTDAAALLGATATVLRVHLGIHALGATLGVAGGTHALAVPAGARAGAGVAAGAAVLDVLAGVGAGHAAKFLAAFTGLAGVGDELDLVEGQVVRAGHRNVALLYQPRLDEEIGSRDESDHRILESRGSDENRLEAGRLAVQKLALGRCRSRNDGHGIHIGERWAAAA